MMLKVTEDAARQIKQVIAARAGELQGLRVGLQDGGCSGYTYLLDFESAPEEEDMVIEAHGARVFVHPLHAPFLMGSVLTWAEGQFEAGFRVENPNVKQMCGCGDSFDV